MPSGSVHKRAPHHLVNSLPLTTKAQGPLLSPVCPQNVDKTNSLNTSQDAIHVPCPRFIGNLSTIEAAVHCTVAQQPCYSYKTQSSYLSARTILKSMRRDLSSPIASKLAVSSGPSSLRRHRLPLSSCFRLHTAPLANSLGRRSCSCQRASRIGGRASSGWPSPSLCCADRGGCLALVITFVSMPEAEVLGAAFARNLGVGYVYSGLCGKSVKMYVDHCIDHSRDSSQAPPTVSARS